MNYTRKIFTFLLIILIMFSTACTDNADSVEMEVVEEVKSEPEEPPEQPKQAEPVEEPEEPTSTNVIVMIVAPEEFADDELFIPLEKFQSAGYDVFVASTIKGEIKGFGGKTHTADMAISEIDPTKLDAIVIVGGGGVIDYFWNDPLLMEKITAVSKADKVVSAICLSPALLAQAGVLNGVKATVCEVPDTMSEFDAGGVDYTNESVTTDGKIVTGNGPEASADFAQAVLDALNQ